MFTSEKYTDKLLKLYRSGQLGEQTRDIVRGWLVSDDNKREKEAALGRMFDREMGRGALTADSYTLTSLARLHDELGFAAVTVPLHPVRVRRTGNRAPWWIAGVAVAAAVAVLSVFFVPAMFDGGTTTSIITDLGPGHELTLPDGSTVKLKPGARLSYASEGFASRRAVEIDGEGLFSVMRDDKHPFTVSAGEIIVKVLGTEFGIAAPRSARSAEVVLRSGRVEVALGETLLALEPLQRATIDLARGTMELMEITKGEIVRLWGVGLSFDGIGLAEALERTGEYFGATMLTDGDLPRADGIVANLDADATLEDVLFVLRSVAPEFDYKIEGDKVRIFGK